MDVQDNPKDFGITVFQNKDVVPLLSLFSFFTLLFAANSVFASEDSYLSPQLESNLRDTSQFRVAVMPMENLSVDGDVAYLFRQEVMKHLKEKGYTLIDDEIINQRLYDLGLTHAGQLGLLDYQQISQLASADAFVFGIVEQSVVQNAVAMNNYSFMCSLQMVDNSGDPLWYALQKRVAKRRLAIDPFNMLLDAVLVNKNADKEKAIEALAEQLLETLPEGPSNVVVDDLFNQAKEVKIVTE